MSFENIIERALINAPQEKTYIDKLLAKDDANKIKELFIKNNLTRSDMLELMYLLASLEAKLVNYGEWERYIILKYSIWVQENIKIMELLFDYKDELERKEKLCVKCNKLIEGTVKNKCVCEVPERAFILTELTQRNLRNIEKLIEHNVKFLIGLYLNIARSSLSVGAVGIKEILKQRFEVAYPQKDMSQPEPERKGLFFNKGVK